MKRSRSRLGALAVAAALASLAATTVVGTGEAVAQQSTAPAAAAKSEAAKPAGRTPMPSIARGTGDACVAPTDWMRRFHMTALNHKRDDTVHDGIRTPKFSLKGCIDCHQVKGADGKAVTVADERHFCRSCHDYAAVKVDCFECHASRPDEAGKAADASRPGEGQVPGHGVASRHGNAPNDELARLGAALGHYLAEGSGANRP